MKKIVKNTDNSLEIISDSKNTLVPFSIGFTILFLFLSFIISPSVIIYIIINAFFFIFVFFKKEFITVSYEIILMHKIFGFKIIQKISIEEINFIYRKDREEKFGGVERNIVVIETSHRKYKIGNGLNNNDLDLLILLIKEECKKYNKYFISN